MPNVDPKLSQDRKETAVIVDRLQGDEGRLGEVGREIGVQQVGGSDKVESLFPPFLNTFSN